jgi:uncharacterized RDD family membrane protein YckC
MQNAATTYELAGMGNRFVAFVIDYLVLGMLSFVLLLLIGSDDMPLGQLLVFDILATLAYNWYFWTQKNGQTPGKRLMNIRVIKGDGSPISNNDALVRVFGYYVGRLALWLGFIWALFDAHNQAWHDKMANTYVIAVPAAERKKTISL